MTNPSSEPTQPGREQEPRFDDRPEARSPRFDDRPDAKSDESAGGGNEGSKKRRTGNPPNLGPGLPDYGDLEPGDPRRLDVEAQRGGQEGTGSSAQRDRQSDR